MIRRIPWTKWLSKAFEEIKQKIVKIPILKHPDLSKTNEISCDASSVGIEDTSSQEDYHIAYFNKKLNETK